jgi:seryl-tRNA synthetase
MKIETDFHNKRFEQILNKQNFFVLFGSKLLSFFKDHPKGQKELQALITNLDSELEALRKRAKKVDKMISDANNLSRKFQETAIQEREKNQSIRDSLLKQIQQFSKE